ncbi:TadE/TadG family type IV pilus assembly protein [Ornithinibacillus sp. 4-3]|uniref:TadE/TadG family type IV pilus assembly protein n=1 Tax=Ornithinibacillus sp. 4-3 TaxID=3231488 RepID=A0AB39HNN8_9BACI
MKIFLKDERGSFTIESSLVFPSLLIFTLIGVFFCIILFQTGTASYSAHRASTNLAYVWNNSQKDIVTGEFGKSTYTGLPGNQSDGLYWRVQEFDLLSLFNLNDFQSTGNTGGKLRRVTKFNNGTVTLKSEYKSNILDGEVKVTATSNLYIPSFMKSVVSDSITVSSTHTVTETPELIRTHNFSKYLWSEFGLDDVMGKAKESIKNFFGGS